MLQVDLCWSLVMTIIRIDGRIPTITMPRNHLHKRQRRWFLFFNIYAEEKQEMIYICLQVRVVQPNVYLSLSESL